MIVSASRRTDLPGYYSEWLLQRLHERVAVAVNPFNPRQRRTVALGPDDVDAFVFWTRDPIRLEQLVRRAERLGHDRWVAHVTITALSEQLEPRRIPPRAAVEGVRRLADRARCPRRAIWRYDPIVLGPQDRPEQHLERFAALASELEGSVRRVVVSFLDIYRKTARRLEAAGYPYEDAEAALTPEARGALVGELVRIAAGRGMEVELCAEPESFEAHGAPATRCVDPILLGELFPDRRFEVRKDPGQRRDCGCAPSVDIGMPDTCLRGCVYCYATRSDRAAVERHRRHDPSLKTLLPVAPSTPATEIGRRELPEGRRETEHARPRLPGL
jgi:DNA repair photolyase